MPRKRKPVLDDLETVAFIQQAIGRHSKLMTPEECKALGLSPGHGTTDTSKWIADLYEWVSAKIHKAMRDRGPYDENMAVAAWMGYALVLWFVRIQRAKAYDPRRPVELRRRALKGWTDYALRVARALLDEENDPKMFKGQRWSDPWDPKAKSGTFR